MCAWLAVTTTPATAQIPPSAEAGRAKEQLPPVLQKPQAQPATSSETLPLQQAPEGADTITLTLTAVTVRGATVYSDAQLRTLYADKLGQKITLADVFAIANAITTHYRNDGYVLSRAVVPQQEIHDGRIRIDVVEGYIDNVIIRNADQLKSRQQIASIAENIKRFRPVNMRDIERYLLLIRDLPGHTVNSLLSPSPRAAGAADIILDVGFDAFSGSISYDNNGTKFLGPTQAALRVQGNSLFLGGDSLTARYIGTGTIVPTQQQELRYGDISYSMPLGDEGASLIFSGTRSLTHPGNSLKPLDAKGESTIFAVEGTCPVIRTRRTNLMFGAQVNAITSSNEVVGIETRDDLRVARLRVNGDHADQHGGVSQLSFELAQGVEAFGASDSNTANLSRAGGRPDFTKVSFDAARWQQISGPFSLFAALAAQYSADRLLSPEEFGFGGSLYGRGYDPSEITGDSGIATKVELQFNGQVSALPLGSYQLFAFHDLGRTFQSDGKIGDDQSAASAGIGFRINITDDLTASTVLAKPLTKRVDATGDKDPRAFFAVAARF